MIQPSTTGAPGPHLVVTPKAAFAIPIATSLQFDAVIQAALNPAVTKLSYVRDIRLGGRLHTLGSILIVRDGVLFTLDLPESGAFRSLDEEGLRLLAFEALRASPLRLTRAEIECGPRCSNARLVWENHRHRVRMSARHSILDALDRSGVLPLRNFDVRREDVFALACENAVDIDLNAEDIDGADVRLSIGPIGPRSRTTRAI
jgi:hypothetical protein